MSDSNNLLWEVDLTGHPASLAAAVARLHRAGAQAVQVLASMGNGWTPAQVDAVLVGAPVPVFGGMFPALIVEGRRVDHGAIVIGHREAATVDVVACDGEQAPLIDATLAGAGRLGTLFVYVDSTVDGDRLLAAIYDTLGSDMRSVGGGTGDLDFARRPTVITPQGLRSGVAVLAAIDEAVPLGVAHGWVPIGSPLLVTEADANEVISINWRPALDVYREVVEPHTGEPLTLTNFAQVAAMYPLIIERVGGEGVVRDPMKALDGGRIQFAGAIPPNTTVSVATGSLDSMIAAASDARERATTDTANSAGAGVALTIDCISRALLLAETVPSELAALRIPGLPQLGAWTIGEVASRGAEFMRLHNKTSVVALIGSVRAST